MKRIVSFVLAAAVLLGLLPLSAGAEEYTVSAQSAMVMCADTGDVVYEKNADEKMLIASITKIMTAIVVIENADMSQSVEILPEWAAVEGSSMYLKCGESYTVYELLLGMMLASGNDAAAALAASVFGSESACADKMNEKAAELGMTGSHFTNPHGLDGAEHYSTARDMARLTVYCMENGSFRDIVSTNSAEIKGETYYNHNRLLREYNGCIGVKTGYTMAAGRTLVSCAERNGLRFVCVTLNAPDDWNDHRQLLDTAFDSCRLISLSKDDFKVRLEVASSVLGFADAVPEHDILLLVKTSDELKLELDAPRILFAGGIAGETVGSVGIYVNGALAARENLVYTDDVAINAEQRLGASERFGRMFSSLLGPYYTDGEML